MVLHRYGGGLSAGAVEGVLSMPLRPLCRIVAAAQRASSGGSTRNSSSRETTAEEHAAIIAELNAKQAELEARQKQKESV